MLVDIRNRAQQAFDDFNMLPWWKKLGLIIIAVILVSIVWKVIKNFRVPTWVTEFFESIQQRLSEIFGDEEEDNGD